VKNNCQYVLRDAYYVYYVTCVVWYVRRDGVSGSSDQVECACNRPACPVARFFQHRTVPRPRRSDERHFSIAVVFSTLSGL